MNRPKEDSELETGLRLLRVGDIERLTTLSRTTIWRLERAGKFPAGRSLPAVPSAKVWLESEVLSWMREQLGLWQNEDESQVRRFRGR
jgi:predicted DNA-binding transcriptional regulator AlpA